MRDDGMSFRCLSANYFGVVGLSLQGNILTHFDAPREVSGFWDNFFSVVGRAGLSISSVSSPAFVGC